MFSIYHWEKDPEIKESLKKRAFEKFPEYLDKFEAQLKKNAGYFVRGKVMIFVR